MPSPRKVPLALKLLYTAFIAVLVPYYWIQYGPVNFLWFCDVALLVTLFALWLESPFLASSQAVGMTVSQAAWVADFICGLVSGKTPIGIAAYMFNPEITLVARGLSLFHGWLPFLLLWLVWKLGYDRRAWLLQWAIAWTIILASYLLDLRDKQGESINWVRGLGGKEQTTLDPHLYIAILLAFFPVVIYLPTHLVFCKVFRPPASPA